MNRLLLILIVVCIAGSAFAQPLALSRGRLPGGGGASGGGQFGLFATVGQPEAGTTLSGGQFAVDTAFLGASIPVPEPKVYFPSGTVTVLEDCGPQTRLGYATFEFGQTGLPLQPPSYALTADRPELFSVAPALDVNRNLTFTPAADANGTATITVVVSADGAMVATNSFFLVITPVNDAPSVVFATNRVVAAEDAGLQRFSGFASFSPGPVNESMQALVGYTVTVDNVLVTNGPALFSVAPAIDNSGQLTFQTTTNANGSARVTVVVQDNGGTANGGVDRSTNIFNLVVTPVNDAPFAVSDNYSVSQGDTLNVNSPGVLVNDSDVEGQPLTVRKATDPLHGTLALNASGGFVYTPVPEFFGTDSFTYRANDGELDSATVATVSVRVFARPYFAFPTEQQHIFSGDLLRFSSTNTPATNHVRVLDPDSPVLTVTLAVTNGTLAVAVTNGLLFPNGTTNTNTLVLTGVTNDLNAALESLSYRSVSNYFGDDTLELLVQDEGGRTNRGSRFIALQVEVPSRGPALDVPLSNLNNTNTGRMVTNTTVVAVDTNLVANVVYNPTNTSVNVVAVDAQDGATNRSSVTLTVQFNDGTTQLVTVPIIVYHPLLAATTNAGSYDGTFGTPLFNLQTGLYEQKVRVQNNTPFDFTALRLTATNLPATVVLQNATLTNGGRSYIDYNLAIHSGSNVTLKLEYFSRDLQPFTPGLKLELLNQQRATISPTNAAMVAVAARLADNGYAPDSQVKNYLQFPTKAGQVYYVQYQDIAGPTWKTSPVPLLGTGFVLNWLDDGPPSTEPSPGPARFYRVVTDR